MKKKNYHKTKINRKGNQVEDMNNNYGVISNVGVV